MVVRDPVPVGSGVSSDGGSAGTFPGTGGSNLGLSQGGSSGDVQPADVAAITARDAGVDASATDSGHTSEAAGDGGKTMRP
jgi:hypothetical protein